MESQKEIAPDELIKKCPGCGGEMKAVPGIPPANPVAYQCSKCLQLWEKEER